MPKEYAVVTTIQTFRHRYVVPMDKLQELNVNETVDPKWALDSVTMEEVKEFSQLHLGEQIIDLNVASEDEILELFDKDNEYLSSWSKDYKLDWISRCWETEMYTSQSQESYHDFMSRSYKESEDTV